MRLTLEICEIEFSYLTSTIGSDSRAGVPADGLPSGSFMLINTEESGRMAETGSLCYI